MWSFEATIARVLRKEKRHHVTLFGKPGCHLCEDARELLVKLSARYLLQVDEVDITADPELFRKYDIRIPVILIDGTVEIGAPITESALRTALR